MPNTPSIAGKRLKDAVGAWRSLRPQKKFLNLTVEELEAELKPCFEARTAVEDLETKLAGARIRRDELDAQGLQLVARLVNAIKSDETEGEDSELLEAMGYVLKSKRQSGLHRKAAAPTVELPKAA